MSPWSYQALDGYLKAAQMVVVCVDLTDAGAPVDAEEWLQKVAQATARSGAKHPGGGQGTQGQPLGICW